MDGLQAHLAATEQKQSDYLGQVAVAELEQQKSRLSTYQVQARFALATMYDRAANPEPEKKDQDAAGSQPGTDTPAPEQQPEGGAQAPQQGAPMGAPGGDTPVPQQQQSGGETPPPPGPKP